MLLLALLSCVFSVTTEVTGAPTVLQSVPFDPFRLECVAHHGLMEISMRLVESQGGRRADTMFTIACDDLDVRFPLNDEALEFEEREDCDWSTPFVPADLADFDMKCGGRAYIAGASRIAYSRVSLLCCQLRTRTPFDCADEMFDAPTSSLPFVPMHKADHVVSGIAFRDEKYYVRFCQLEQRENVIILADVETTRAPTTTAAIEVQRTTLMKQDTTAMFEHKKPSTDRAVEVREIDSDFANTNSTSSVEAIVAKLSAAISTAEKLTIPAPLVVDNEGIVNPANVRELFAERNATLGAEAANNATVASINGTVGEVAVNSTFEREFVANANATFVEVATLANSTLAVKNNVSSSASSVEEEHSDEPLNVREIVFDSVNVTTTDVTLEPRTSPTTTAPPPPTTSPTTTAPPPTTVELLHFDDKYECPPGMSTKDMSGTIIACGDASRVWLPMRCPMRTHCLRAPDVAYRVCCEQVDVVLAPTGKPTRSTTTPRPATTTTTTRRPLPSTTRRTTVPTTRPMTITTTTVPRATAARIQRRPTAPSFGAPAPPVRTGELPFAINNDERRPTNVDESLSSTNQRRPANLQNVLQGVNGAPSNFVQPQILARVPVFDPTTTTTRQTSPTTSRSSSTTSTTSRTRPTPPTDANVPKTPSQRAPRVPPLIALMPGLMASDMEKMMTMEFPQFNDRLVPGQQFLEVNTGRAVRFQFKSKAKSPPRVPTRGLATLTPQFTRTSQGPVPPTGVPSELVVTIDEEEDVLGAPTLGEASIDAPNKEFEVSTTKPPVCNNSVAVVDSKDGLVVACGIGEQDWLPTRCPPTTRCSVTPDANYRVCCPV